MSEKFKTSTNPRMNLTAVVVVVHQIIFKLHRMLSRKIQAPKFHAGNDNGGTTNFDAIKKKKIDHAVQAAGS
jgi:hypothetical protein